MIAPSLYAYLRARGVRLSVALGEGVKLRVQAPCGALTEALRSAIERNRDELTQFVFELDERAAILEHEHGNTREVAEELARGCVAGGYAGPDGALCLRDIAEHHPTTIAFLEKFAPLGTEIVEVRPMERRAEAA